MATKTLTIMEDAYEALAREKLPDESFSDTIRRITKKSKGIEEFFGCWSEEAGNEVEKAIEERRARNKDRAKRRDELFTA